MEASEGKDRDDMEFHTLANSKHKQNHRQQPSMMEVVHIFLSNMTHRFGENSLEVTTVIDILKTFQQGNMSKRDTLVAIRLTLGAHEDLKQDLMNVLFHGEADWGVGDFDFSGPDAQSCPPQFLQPVHQPQMRLPSISSSWYPTHQTFPIFDHTTLSSYNGTHSPGRLTSPRILENSNALQFTSPTFFDSAKYMPYTGEINDAEECPPTQHLGNVAQSSPMEYGWERGYYSDREMTNYDRPWVPVESHSVLEHAPFPTSNHQYPTPTSDSCVPYHHSPKKEDFVTDNSYILGDPVAVPLGQSVEDMPPPSKKRHRNVSTSRMKAEDVHTENQNHGISPAIAITKRGLSRQPEGATGEAQTRPEVPRIFIHGLCGKGFTSRSRVKKHHWGAKNDNLETTSGCWAKHNKPNVSWNEHPSCKEEAPTPRAAKKPTRPILKLTKSEREAPRATAPLATHSTITGISTLQDLPRTVADAVSPCNANQNDLGNIESYRSHQLPARDNFDGPRITNPFALEDVGSYHSHRLPSQSSFDSLLTAVNVASRIEAPKAQARHDSIAYQLDVQAVAAERNRQYVSSWRDASCGREEMFTYGHYRPAAAHGLGISDLQKETPMFSQMKDHTHSPSTDTPTGADWDSRRVSTSSSSKCDDVIIYSVSPGPDTKRQKS